MSYGLLDNTVSRYGLFDFINVDSEQVYAAHKQLQEGENPSPSATTSRSC